MPRFGIGVFLSFVLRHCSPRKAVALLIALSSLIATGMAQSDPAAGIRPFSTQVSGQYDSLDLATGSVTLNIPLRSKGGKFPFSVSLIQNSHASINSNGGPKYWYVNTSLSPVPFAANLATTPYKGAGHNYGACGTHSTDYEYDSFTATDQTGASHPFRIKIDQYGCVATSQTALATDNSGFTLSASYSTGAVVMKLWDRSGNQLSHSTSNGYGYSSTVTDTDQVVATESSSWTQSNPTQQLTFTDTLNQTIFSGGWAGGNQGPSVPDTYSYTDANGDTQNIVVNYTGYYGVYNFGCTLVPDGGYSTTLTYLPTKVTLPSGQGSILISYEQTPNGNGYTYNSNYTTGRLGKITYPTGGSVTYGYSGGNNGINCSSGVVPTLTRTVSDGTTSSTWKYVNSNASATAGNYTVTETDPATNTTVYNFNGELQTEKQVKGSGGTVLTTTITCYNGNFSSCPTPTGVPLTISQTDTFAYPNGWSSASLVEAKFNAAGSVTETKTYDFGAATSNPPTVAPTIAPLADTTITYGGGGGASCGPLSTYTYDHPCSVTTVNSAGAKISGVSYTYNAGGHATQTVRWVSPSSSLTSSASYQSNGILTSAADVNGAITYFNTTAYACNNMLSTTTTLPITGLSTTQTWDTGCNGPAVTQSNDLNQQPTKYVYADPLDRITTLTDPELNATTVKYPSTTSAESTLNFNGSVSTVDVLSAADGLGRLLSTQNMTAQSSSTYDNLIQYSYGWNTTGAFTKKTLPGATNATTTQLDSAGRTTAITDGGGGVASFTYSDNDVLRSGPSNSRQIEYDGLGRIKSVCEISSQTGSAPCGQNTAASGFLTTYSYGTNSVTVIQNKLGTSQQRSYSYDGLGRLASETNPESGTTSYVYDTIPASCFQYSENQTGNLVAKSDANGNLICYHYDALHRLIDASNSTLTSCKRYRYDSTGNGVTGSAPSVVTVANISGRLMEAETDNCSAWPPTPITDEWFSYSPRGETTDVYESTPNSNGYYHTKATYFANGALNTLGGVPVTQSATRSWTFGVDGEGRPNAATDAYASVPLVSSAYFFPSYSSTTINLGSGDSDTYGYDANTGRMTSYKYAVGASGTIKYVNGTLSWSANGTLGSLGITDQFDTGNVQNCTYLYDDLSRIQDANCLNGSTAVFHQGFTYDPFGNIVKTDSRTFAALYDPSTNHITNLSASYDANGNLKGITDSIAHTYTWDAYGKPATIDGVGLTYDALGRMVEQNRSGTYQEILYSPVGKTALMTRQITQNIFLPLPGGEQATYTGSTIRFRHSDWLGTYRLESNENEQEYGDVAYAPFGENYAVKNLPYLGFTGQNEDTIGQNNYTAPALYDFLYREYSPNAGRWISPDPAGLQAVDFGDPQSFNRYTYVANNPLGKVDPLGLFISGPLVQIYVASAQDFGTCTMDGLNTPCRTVSSFVHSGAAAQCPQNDCRNVTLQSDGFYRLQVSLYLVMNCYGATNNCDWSHWSRQFVAGLNDNPFDFSSYYASYAQAAIYERNYMSPQDLQIRTIANRLSVPFMTPCEAFAHGIASAAIGVGPFVEGGVAVAAWTGGVAGEAVAISVCE
jgi:RHS repeat-associated protein